MGFLDDADVSAQDAPDDPFGFGKEFWPVQITEVKDRKVTKDGDKYGTQLVWECLHPDKSDIKLGFGNWIQLPVPKPLQSEVPWDPKSQEAKKIIFDLVKLYEALGFKRDEMGGLGPDDLVNRPCLAKIFVRQNDEGFWQFNITAHKPMPEEGWEGSTSSANGQSNGQSTDDAIRAEMEAAKAAKAAKAEKAKADK